MKYILLPILILFTYLGTSQIYYSTEDIPDPKLDGDGFVSDPDNFISEGDEAVLNNMITNIRDTKGFEVAVVVVNSINYQEPLPFATDLGNLWGVGKGDRGIVILAAISDRNMAIATGYDAEQYFPDLVTQQIQQEEIIPYFKLENYGKGLIAGVEVIEAIALDENVPDYVEEAKRDHEAKLTWEYISISLGLLLVILTIIVSPKSKTILTNLTIIGAAIAVSTIAYFWLLRQTHTASVIRDGSVILSFIAITINAFITLKNETEKVWPFVILVTFAVGTPLAGLYLYDYKAIVFIYLAGAAIMFGIFMITYIITLIINDPYRKYHALKVFKLDVFAYIFPFPMFITDMIVENLLESWRNRVRYSKKTGLEMRKLSEIDDNKHLQKGQIKEEQVKSVDYDVWVTDEADDILILKYTSWFSKYSTCEKCKYKTWYLVYDKTISSATYSSSGTGEKKKACAHCAHQSITRYTIPKLSPPSSSSSSSGGWSSSSSSGGSWGGGSFGGGGSSSSW